jgi:hypothetical protein
MKKKKNGAALNINPVIDTSNERLRPSADSPAEAKQESKRKRPAGRPAQQSISLKNKPSRGADEEME